MALRLADRGEKLHSETLFIYFCWTCLFRLLQVTTGLVYTCKRIFQKSACKSRNQCRHQQLCVNFLSQGQFCCIAEGSKYLHWIGLYLSFHLSSALGPFVHGRLQNLKTSEDTFGHDITPLTKCALLLLTIDWVSTKILSGKRRRKIYCQICCSKVSFSSFFCDNLIP